MSTTTRIQIEYAPIDRLHPDPRNPRRISEEALRRLTASLDGFGVVDPVIAQAGTGRVIGGHQRLRAARELGLTEVPVVYLPIDDATADRLNIALNNPAMMGEYDDRALAELLTSLAEEGDGDLSLTGFDDEEIATLLARFDEHIPADTENDQPPEPTPEKLVECPACGHQFTPPKK